MEVKFWSYPSFGHMDLIPLVQVNLGGEFSSIDPGSWPSEPLAQERVEAHFGQAMATQTHSTKAGGPQDLRMCRMFLGSKMMGPFDIKMVKMLVRHTIFFGGSEFSVKHRQTRLQNTPNPFGYGATMRQKWTHKTMRIFLKAKRKAC